MSGYSDVFSSFEVRSPKKIHLPYSHNDGCAGAHSGVTRYEKMGRWHAKCRAYLL
jgi:hypothetical protein